jgi:RNA polymerase sigma factor (sigma-70 family)
MAGADGEVWEDERFCTNRARAALSRLPPSQREAVVLLEIEGCTLEEIAGLQGSSITAVKTRVSRGRERLRAFYANAGVRPANVRNIEVTGGIER